MKKRLSAIFLIFILILSVCPAIAETEELVTVIVVTDESFDFKSFSGLGEIKSVYTESFSGFSACVYEKDIEKIKSLDGVISVSADIIYDMPRVEPSKEVFSFFSETSGFDGEGMTVAVIDAGFNVTNPIYSLTDETTVRHTRESVEKLLSEKDFIAEVTDEEETITVDDLYRSAKIPFAYDYSENDLNVYNAAIRHGNAVSGIIGGNSKGEYTGIIPEVQLVLLKVRNSSGTIAGEWILNAFEDAVKLGVDAVNISIGSISGFTTDTSDPFNMNLPFSNAREDGIFVAVAAGNDGMLNENGMSKDSYSGGYPKVTNTDYGLVSAPSTANDAVSVAAANVESGKIAGFSSWGVTPDLVLKPDITAKGTNYYVADNFGYSYGQGTSFATPDLCARALIVKKELQDRGVSEDKISYLSEQLLMSTADIIYNSNDIAVSPRNQGSGMVNTERAISANSVLYGSDGKAKLSLKDNLSNEFSFSFNIENLTDDVLTYTPSLELITDGYSGEHITGKSVRVPHNASFFPQKITLKSKETKTVTVTVKADSGWINENSKVFTNGFYLEGFVKMTSDSESLNIPFTGYYGSWFAPSVFIPGDTNYGFGLANIINGNLFYLGNNFYKSASASGISDYSKIAFSPNEDGSADTTSIFAGLYRNTYLLYWEIQDESGSEIYSSGQFYLPKTYGLSLIGYPPLRWTGINNNKEKVADGQYYLYAAAVLDYEGKDVLRIADEVTLPVYVDTRFPEIEGYAVREENGRKLLDIYISDNHYIQGAAAYDKSGVLINNDLDPENNVATIDITGNGFIDIEAMDYAFNKVTENITIADEYIVYFDSSDMISRIETTKNNIYKSGHNFDYSGLSLNEGEEYAKIFIWTDNLNPLYYECKVK